MTRTNTQPATHASARRRSRRAIIIAFDPPLPVIVSGSPPSPRMSANDGIAERPRPARTRDLKRCDMRAMQFESKQGDGGRAQGTACQLVTPMDCLLRKRGVPHV